MARWESMWLAMNLFANGADYVLGIFEVINWQRIHLVSQPNQNL